MIPQLGGNRPTWPSGRESSHLSERIPPRLPLWE
jgi:hypothetical protein